MLILVGLSIGGCRSLLPTDREKEEEAVSGVPSAIKLPVGTVHLVDAEEGFVLVRSSRFLEVEPERELIVTDLSGQESARLRVSPARKGTLLTADILAGKPEVGQHVLMEQSTRDSEIEDSDDEVQVLE